MSDERVSSIDQRITVYFNLTYLKSYFIIPFKNFTFPVPPYVNENSFGCSQLDSNASALSDHWM